MYRSTTRLCSNIQKEHSFGKTWLQTARWKIPRGCIRISRTTGRICETRIMTWSLTITYPRWRDATKRKKQKAKRESVSWVKNHAENTHTQKNNNFASRVQLTEDKQKLSSNYDKFSIWRKTFMSSTQKWPSVRRQSSSWRTRSKTTLNNAEFSHKAWRPAATAKTHSQWPEGADATSPAAEGKETSGGRLWLAEVEKEDH